MALPILIKFNRLHYHSLTIYSSRSLLSLHKPYPFFSQLHPVRHFKMSEVQNYAPPSVREVILAGFAADSVALGAHWEYNAKNIHDKFGRLETLQPPIKEYHKGKTAGDQTHFGDTALFLLESLVASPQHQFDSETYTKHLVDRWETHNAYRDHATNETIKNLKAGVTGPAAASNDDDFGHAAKFFPLLAVYKNEADLVKATKTLVSLQQSGPNSQVTGEFLARVTFRVYHGRIDPVKAIEQVSNELNNAWLSGGVKKGLESAGTDDTAFVHGLGEAKTSGTNVFYSGLTCSINYGLPAFVHYIAKYAHQKSPASTAVIADINLGGNSAARSIAVATVLSAYAGVSNDAKLQEWIGGLHQKGKIEELLSQLGA